MNWILKKLLNHYHKLPSLLFKNKYLHYTKDINFFNNLQKILRKYGVDCCLDVGANIGHYSLILRKTGFENTIIAFEPIKKYYLLSVKNLSLEKNVCVENIGIGTFDGTQEIHIASNDGLSSSFLEFNNNKIFTETKKELVEIVQIESYLATHSLDSNNLFLKMDVQGFEFEILKSISDFSRFKVIQLEMSFFPYYEDQPDYKTVNAYMEKQGYSICLMKTNGNTNSGEIIELDVVYVADDVSK